VAPWQAHDLVILYFYFDFRSEASTRFFSHWLMIADFLTFSYCLLVSVIISVSATVRVSFCIIFCRAVVSFCLSDGPKEHNDLVKIHVRVLQNVCVFSESTTTTTGVKRLFFTFRLGLICDLLWAICCHIGGATPDLAEFLIADIVSCTTARYLRLHAKYPLGNGITLLHFVCLSLCHFVSKKVSK